MSCDLTLIPIPVAAEKYHLDVRRLRGAIHRDLVRLGDPVGSLKTDEVYEETLPWYSAHADKGTV